MIIYQLIFAIADMEYIKGTIMMAPIFFSINECIIMDDPYIAVAANIPSDTNHHTIVWKIKNKSIKQF